MFMAIDLRGFDTQNDAMTAITSVMLDWQDGHMTHKEALGVVMAVCEEWRS